MEFAFRRGWASVVRVSFAIPQPPTDPDVTSLPSSRSLSPDLTASSSWSIVYATLLTLSRTCLSECDPSLRSWRLVRCNSCGRDLFGRRSSGGSCGCGSATVMDCTLPFMTVSCGDPLATLFHVDQALRILPYQTTLGLRGLMGR